MDVCYVVSFWLNPEERIVSHVFTTREKAEEWVGGDQGYEIEEVLLD